jgi:hypothetical protein
MRDRWTRPTIACYNRGCRCEGCSLIPPLETLHRCGLKAIVIELVRLYGRPEVSSQGLIKCQQDSDVLALVAAGYGHEQIDELMQLKGTTSKKVMTKLITRFEKQLTSTTREEKYQELIALVYARNESLISCRDAILVDSLDR